MSKVKITGHASGSGTLTLTGPNTNSDRTITLPDETGTVALGVGISDSADATAITIDSAENVGIGVTPESWISTYSTLQMGDSLALSARTTEDTVNLSNNAYADSVDSRWEYIGANGSSEAALLVLDNGGKFVFRTAPAGAADAEITWTTAMSIDNDGYVTMPLQPAFQVTLGSDQSNFAHGSDVLITFDSEVFDQNSDFSSNTFTAPVTGKYQFNLVIRCESVDTAPAYYQFKIVTSNRTYETTYAPKFSSDPAYFNFNFSILADMDASDTCTAKVHQHAGGTAQSDINSSSYFTGHLVC